MAVQQLSVNILSNPKDRQQLLDVLSECSNSLARMESEKDLIKESVKKVCDDLQLPKRLVNKLVKVYHKQNYSEEVATHEQFQILYETVVE
jgi:hypothetical protein